jgi:hypothetical protein
MLFSVGFQAREGLAFVSTSGHEVWFSSLMSANTSGSWVPPDDPPDDPPGVVAACDDA